MPVLTAGFLRGACGGVERRPFRRTRHVAYSPGQESPSMEKALVDQVLTTAESVLSGGWIAANGHGNVSVRASGGTEMYYSSASSLTRLRPEGVARVGMDGKLLEGELPPIQGAVVAMHTAIYQDHPDVGCVIHTHAPYATAFAVANRPIGCWIEALAMFGLGEGVPLAGYAPRGSEQAVSNIRAAVRDGASAVLLANHGLLVFHRTPELAVVVGGVVEEAARAAVHAERLGGPVEVPQSMRAAALQRALAFTKSGTQRA